MARNILKFVRVFSGILIALFFGYSGFSQTDTPCGAPNLSVGIGMCTNNRGASAANYSLQTNAANGGIASCGWPSNLSLWGNPDVWYAFTAPLGGTVNIQTQTTGSSYLTNGSMAVYSGSCTNLTEIGCNTNGNGMPGLLLNGLIGGNTYYIRFWGRHANTASNYEFDICLFAPVPPPPNDACINATAASVNRDAYCNLITSGTVLGATASSQASCFFGPSAVNDVWFSFVALNTTHNLTFRNVSGPAPTFSIHSGTCTSMAILVCNNVTNNLIVGNTYYVRVYTGSITDTTTFDLCISSPAIQPICATNPAAGNTVCTATPICNLDGYCGSTSSSYTVDYWPQLLGAFCGTIENNSFLSFVADSTTISFHVWVTSSTLPTGIQIMVFSAANCSSGPVTDYTCYNPGNIPVSPPLITVQGLTIGNTYYIMIDGNAGNVADYVIGAHEGFRTPVEAATVPGDTNICLGQSIDLFAKGGTGNYTWSPGAGLNNITSDTVTFSSTTAGSYTFQAHSASTNPLCPSDSAIVNLNVNTPDTVTDVHVACGNFTWIDGNTYIQNNNSAIYLKPASTIYQCDTVTLLDLTISNSIDSTDIQTTCKPFTWVNGITYTSSNDTAIYTINGAGPNSCDTNLTLDLTIDSAIISTDTIIACNAYTWIDGITYTSNNTTAKDTLISGIPNGCDSIFRLNLTIMNPTTIVDTVIACNSHTWINGVTYTSNNNTATDTIVGGDQNGCDSIITLDLTIFTPSMGIDTVITCDPYTWMNGITYTSNNNTDTDTIIGGDQNGCDSIITLNLTITPASTGIDTIVTCNSYTWTNGITYISNNNTAMDTIVGGAQSGCDSIITLNLTITPPATGIETVTTCNSYTWTNGITYTSNNSAATDTIFGGAQNGCDSVTTLNLTINTNLMGLDNVDACNSYTWIDGNTYTSNNYIATHTIPGGAQNGCDSIITLQLTIHNPVQGVDVLFACDSYIWIDGNTYTSSNNTAIFTIANGSSYGCDSTITLNLTMGIATKSISNVAACDSLTWLNGITYTSDVDTATFTIPNGSLTGCDSIITLNLTINHSVKGTDIQEACESFTWIDGEKYTNSNNTATYIIDGGANTGCDSILTLDLTIYPNLEPELGDRLSICGESVELTLMDSFSTYLWNNGNTTPSIFVNSEGIYSVTVTDIHDCSGFDFIDVIDDCPVSIWIPNAFTPNGDVLNQTFLPVISGEIRNYVLYIFDRWGTQIFESTDVDLGWDGKFKGKYMLDGIYTYKIFFNPKIGRERKEYVGKVNLLR